MHVKNILFVLSSAVLPDVSVFVLSVIIDLEMFLRFRQSA